MKALLERYLPLRNAEGGGSGGGAPAAGAGDPPPAGGAGGGAAAAAGAGSPPAAAAASGPYRPQGLPDTMYGKDDRETIDKMHTALAGYRQRDSSVPDKVEAYSAIDVDKAPEAIRPFMSQLSTDPVFAAASKVALEERLPVATLHKLTTAIYQAGHEAGILEAPLDVKAERSALLPDSAKSLPQADQDKAIDARMQANEDFVNLMVTNQKIDKDVAEHALLMLMDTAKGNRFLEAVQAMATGQDRAQPLSGAGAAAGGQNQREALRARLAAPEMQLGHRNFSREAYDALMEEYRKLPS